MNDTRDKERLQDWFRMSDIIITLILVMAMVIGTYWAVMFIRAQYSYKAPAPGTLTEHELFKDTLETVLVIAGAAIALMGVGAYKILTQQIEIQVTQKVEARYIVAITDLRRSISYNYWLAFQDHDKMGSFERANEYLQYAILHMKYLAKDLHEDNHHVEHQLCNARNDWAWYISEQIGRTTVSDAEKKLALYFADYLEKRLGKYPEDASQYYYDTIVTVREKISSL